MFELGLEYCIMELTREYGKAVSLHFNTKPITEAVIRPTRLLNHKTELDWPRVDISRKSTCSWVQEMVANLHCAKHST